VKKARDGDVHRPRLGLLLYLSEVGAEGTVGWRGGEEIKIKSPPSIFLSLWLVSLLTCKARLCPQGKYTP
jgi:hypothetical protein